MIDDQEDFEETRLSDFDSERHLLDNMKQSFD